jgi:hypothetical protein
MRYFNLQLPPNMENETKSKALALAYAELALQREENRRLASELFIANKELAYQNEEKKKRVSELVIANEHLCFQNLERGERASELVVANKELAFQNGEKKKRASELIIASKQLKETEDCLKEHILKLDEILVILSHKVRQPIANILGLSALINCSNHSKEIKQPLAYLKRSVSALDVFTRELTTFVNELERKWKKEWPGCK